MLTEKYIKQFALFYGLCFLANYCWSLYHGLLFSTLQPVFFINKLDITGNLFMLTDLQHHLIQSAFLRFTFDIFYLILPLLLVFACARRSRWQTIAAVSTVAFHTVYIYFFTTMSFVSIEVFVGFMLVPVLFIARQPRNFYFGMHSLRILFLLFFFSSALWKIRAGGIFNIDQLSAILARQHAAYLLSTNNWFSQLISYLIDHQRTAYLLYFFAFAAEFLFVTGLLTRKFDRYLIILFCGFACFNYFLMEINYFTWLPFLGCLYFSKYQPAPETMQ